MNHHESRWSLYLSMIIKPYIIKPLYWPWITMNPDDHSICPWSLNHNKPYIIKPLYWPWITMNPDGHSICPWSSYSHDIPVMVMPWPLLRRGKARLFEFIAALTDQPVPGSRARAVHSSGGAAGGVVSESQGWPGRDVLGVSVSLEKKQGCKKPKCGFNHGN